MPNKIKIVYVDMDGVTVDWLTGITIGLGKSMDIYQSYANDLEKKLGWSERIQLLGSNEMTELMSHTDFWVELQPFGWTDELITTLSQNFKLVFLSKPSSWASAAAGKTTWCNIRYPNIPLILCNNKELVASEDKYLIDDDEWQTSRFSKAGGHSWLFADQFALSRLNPTEMTNYINSIVEHIKSI